MNEDFAFFCLKGEMDRNIQVEAGVERHPLFSSLKKRISKKSYYRGLLNKKKVIIGEYHVLKDCIPCYMFPFTKEDKEHISEEQLNQFMNRILKQYKIKRAYCIGNLKENGKERVERDRTVLKELYLKELINEGMKKKKIKKKDLRLVLLDSKDERMDFILNWITEDLNYLTIITDRQEYFREFIDKIYDTSGLIVVLEPFTVCEQIEGNLVLDMAADQYKCYKYFEKDSYVIDIESTSKKRLYCKERRNDLTINYDIKISYNGDTIPNDIVMNYLRAKSYRIEDMYTYTYHSIFISDVSLKVALDELKMTAVVL